MDSQVGGDNELFAEAAAEFKRIATENDVPELLVGAFARDLILERRSDRPSPRRTRDLDFGVQVDSWSQFERLKRALIESKWFQPFGSSGHSHKVLFRGKMEVDLIPFGGVAGVDGKLACWPDDFGQEMNVIGYQEALEQAETVRVGECEVRVISAEAFVALKILAWNDRPMQRQKDPLDIAYFLRNYGQFPGVADQLWSSDNKDVIEALDDFERQTIRLLGRNIAKAFGPRAGAALRQVLEREIDGKEFLLARQMKEHYKDLEEALTALSDLKSGLMNSAPSPRI